MPQGKKTKKINVKTKTPGSAERAKLVTALSSDQAAAHLVMAWRESPPHYKAQRVDLDQSVAGQFLSLARETATDLAERSYVPYDAEWPLKPHEYFALVDDEIPAKDLFDDVQDFLNLDRFTRARLTKPRLYIVPVQTESGTAYFGKRMAYLKVLGRQANAFSAVWDGETFSKLERSVATFSKDFDWVLWAETLYVLNAAGFHAEFRDNAAVRAAVVDHVKMITKKLSIQNVHKFIDRCQSSVPMASKLAKVAEGGIWAEPVDELKSYAKKYKIDIEWDDDEIVFDDAFERQWDILKLLDEDRTQGPVSGRKYESSAKRTV